MKTKAIRVNWNLELANEPRLEILVDKIPSLNDLRYVRHPQFGLWYAEHEGYVNFYSWDGEKNEGGYCGHEFPIKLANGNEVTLLGPWSSRVGSMNTAGFGPCVDVSLTDSSEAYKRGCTFFAAAVTLKLVEEAINRLGINIHMHKEVDPCEGVTYYPALVGMTPQQSKDYILEHQAA